MAQVMKLGGAITGLTAKKNAAFQRETARRKEANIVCSPLSTINKTKKHSLILIGLAIKSQWCLLQNRRVL